MALPEQVQWLLWPQDLHKQTWGQGEAEDVIVQVDIVILGSVPDTAGFFSCQDPTLNQLDPKSSMKTLTAQTILAPTPLVLLLWVRLHRKLNLGAIGRETRTTKAGSGGRNRT